jgi:hypothetical protein
MPRFEVPLRDGNAETLFRATTAAALLHALDDAFSTVSRASARVGSIAASIALAIGHRYRRGETRAAPRPAEALTSCRGTS